MNREFLDLYNVELQLLNEQARQFAEEYPGVAERLGGLLDDRIDPLIGGLLEGAAFLAARVQLKLKHEFPEFTENLLEQLVPHYLAPTPSMMIVKASPVFGDPSLREGRAIPRGSYLDANFRQLDRQISCRYRLCGDVTIWPFELVGAEYHSSPTPIQALGIPVGADVLSGLRLTLTHRSAARPEDEPSDADVQKKPEFLIAGCRTSQLPLYFTGAEADAVALYELLFAHCRGVYFRYLDSFGDPVVLKAPPECLQQVGFDPEDALFPSDRRVFEGFDLLPRYGRRALRSTQRPPSTSSRNPSIASSSSQTSTSITSFPTAATTWTMSLIACWRFTPTTRTAGKKCRYVRFTRPHPCKIRP
jgi:type VI secretion system protein ImpG